MTTSDETIFNYVFFESVESYEEASKRIHEESRKRKLIVLQSIEKKILPCLTQSAESGGGRAYLSNLSDGEKELLKGLDDNFPEFTYALAKIGYKIIDKKNGNPYIIAI